MSMNDFNMDNLNAIHNLTAAGLEPELAEIIISAQITASEHIIDKKDLATNKQLLKLGMQLRVEMATSQAALATELRKEMSDMKDELRKEMSDMKDELRKEMSAQGNELKGEIATLSKIIEQLDNNVKLSGEKLYRKILITVISVMLGFTGIIAAIMFALLKYLSH